MSFLWNFVIILLLVMLNGFFVAIEFATVSVRRTRIAILAEEGNRTAHLVEKWLAKPASRDHLIAASQLGITIVSLALGAVGENTFEALMTPYFHRLQLPAALTSYSQLLSVLPLVFSLMIVTSLHVVLGEQVPKVATLHNPERVILLGARPMHIFNLIFKWFVDALDWSTRQILALLGLKMVGEHSVAMTVDELKRALDESEQVGMIAPPDHEMLNAILDLDELVVRQVMTPRTEIIAFEADTPLTQVIALSNRYPFTKFPVYEEDIDQIIGVIHVKELIQRFYDDNCQNCTARELARETLFVPESIPVKALLRDFRSHHQHMAIVLDEFGGTAGLVTLEDLLEEIIGEVSAPFDTDLPQIQHNADGSVIIDGLTLIEDVNEALGLNFETGDYDTIAGFMLSQMGRIPEVLDAVEVNGVRLEVLSMDGKRIERILLKRLGRENPTFSKP